MTHRTCSRDGCDMKHRAKGLCIKHWNDAYRKPQLREVACVVCGHSTVKNAPGVKRRPVCSARCRSFLRYGEFPWEHAQVVGPVPKSWPPAHRLPAPLAARAPITFASGRCAWCNEWFTMDGRVTGVIPRYCTERCSRSAHKAAHRERRGQFGISPVRRLAIYERDRWTCQLCGQPVDRDAHWSHNLAPSLDHIECQSWTLLPDHSERNLRLAHRICNSIRGDADRPILLPSGG